jgi:galactokinase
VHADAARDEFEDVFGTPPSGVVLAPGRVNLIGEHTDYNDGFVLPMAIDRGMAIAFAPRDDDKLRVWSNEFGHSREVMLDGLRRRAAGDSDRSRRGGWFGYVVGVAWAMYRGGLAVRGADLAIVSDLPTAAGLSSSAALEVGVARSLAAASALEWDPRAAALMAQRAEHEFAGVACGIMDQLSVAAAHEGCALLLDCRSLDTRDVPLPRDVRIAVFDTGVRRSLTTSAYNERREACERAVAAVQTIDGRVRALRDVDMALLERARGAMDAVAFRRASHVVPENHRPVAMAAALAAGDLSAAGKLMADSHASLRDLYEVSCPELDAIVELASAQASCHGARLTGAGFGGCAIALVDANAVDVIVKSVAAGYKARTGRDTTAFVCRPSAGAHVVTD